MSLQTNCNYIYEFLVFVHAPAFFCPAKLKKKPANRISAMPKNKRNALLHNRMLIRVLSHLLSACPGKWLKILSYIISDGVYPAIPAMILCK